MPLGVKATITYVVVGRDQLAKQQITRSEIGEAGSTSSLLNLSNLSTTPLDHQLYLLEEIAATAFKPLASLISIKQNKLIPKTENLVKVLENLGGPQKDLISALSELNGIRTHRERYEYEYSTNGGLGFAYCFNDSQNTYLLNTDSDYQQMDRDVQYY
ncbi:hypothetical protein J4E91_004111 [Alternaria rosae]|nr:hypothetical protein J4E91_004111 [Alternaria rosae]